MKLFAVEIENFRSVLGPLQLQLGAPTLLAGRNDAGKTATIDAIRFLLGFLDASANDPTQVSQGDGWTPASHVSVIGEFKVRSHERDEFGLPERIRMRRFYETETAAERLEIERIVPVDERLQDLEPKLVGALKELLAEHSLPTGGNKAELIERLRTQVVEKAVNAPAWKPCPKPIAALLPEILYFEADRDDAVESGVQQVLQSSYRQALASEEFVGTVTELERALEAELVASSTELKKHIQDRVADSDEIVVEPEVSFKGGPLKVNVARITSEGRRIPLATTGSGHSRRLALAVWEYATEILTDDADAVVIYDEPDTHLDYKRQRELMSMIRDQAAHENLTMVVATHSMNLIDGVDLADLVHVIHDGTATTFEPLGLDAGAHLAAIAVSVGLRNTALLHERLFVGVEGETERATLPLLYKHLRGRHIETAGIAIWDCGSNDGALKFARFLVEHNRNVAFLVDSDSKKKSKHFTHDALKKAGLDPASHAYYLGDPDELEDIFPDADWVRVANQKWPRADAKPWKAQHFSGHREPGSKFSSKVYDMIRVEATASPSGKPEMLTELVHSLVEARGGVPDILVKAFEELEARAAA